MPGTKRKMDPPPGRPGECASAEESVVMQLSALKRMTVVELKTKWESLYGSSAPNNSRSYLELRLGYRIQELTLGGLSRETRRTLDLLADEIEGQARYRSIIADPRNPVVGTRLVREWVRAVQTLQGVSVVNNVALLLSRSATDAYRSFTLVLSSSSSSLSPCFLLPSPSTTAATGLLCVPILSRKKRCPSSESSREDSSSSWSMVVSSNEETHPF